ncbi:NAD(P)H-dependent oxidoreductase [Otariodibacter sp.]|uniref:NAD(P)H-dependent oxidoreductase n=1 Tax=Otariodibacter sp. TaxID=3030919 RepID=UPI00263580BD|nr:NAD(P)H-dependent oxidoreductase [Otariodibacter sp.]
MTNITKEAVLEGFHYRASTRHYDPTKKIPPEDFNYILELARLSPSSVGSEPWKFVVIQNQELRQKLKPASWGMQSHVDAASHLVVILAKKNARYDSEFLRESMIRRGLTAPEKQAAALEKYKKFQIDDAHIADNERTLFDWASKQTYIALANMMTGAALVGIDSCPVEGFDYDEVNRILVEAGAFDPKEWGVSVMVTFGYRNREIKPRLRKPMDEIVTWIE